MEPCRTTSLRLGPLHLHCGNPQRRTDACQDNIAWNFSDNISNCPSSLHIVQLIAIETQLLFPADSCEQEARKHLKDKTHIPDTNALLILD
jgi:hypothetical protein